MTLQQLRYVTTVAETGTMSEAARRLFVSQPGLTKAWSDIFRICKAGAGAGITFGRAL